MALKGWMIGIGVVIVVGIVAIIAGIGYLGTRASQFQEGMKDAQAKYADTSKEFPFKKPANGELTADRFSGYLRVRGALATAMISARDMNSPTAIFELPDLPGKIGKAHVDALRAESMSIDEYRWITRQIYTVVAAEGQRENPDKTIIDLVRDLKMSMRVGPGVRYDSDSGPFDTGLIDYTWLRAPDATRALVRDNTADLVKARNAVMADTILLGLR